MKTILITVGILLIAATVILSKFSRFGLESPDYQLIQKEGSFEIRDYPDMVMVSTPMSNDREQGTSFMRLFRYISGSNDAGQKIAMTTPVITSRENGSPQMSFVVPKDVADGGPPDAQSELVELETMAGGRFAAYRFSGSWDVTRFEDSKRKLVTWLERQKLTTIGQPMIANYDPPFTPSFLKRNEILIRIGE